jgi:hypothetical protein
MIAAATCIGDLLLTDFRLENARERGALLVLHGWQPPARP